MKTKRFISKLKAKLLLLGLFCLPAICLFAEKSPVYAPYSGAINGSALNSTLGSFTAKKLNENSISLSWTSLKETGFSHYELESSMDGLNFLEQGLVMTEENNLDMITYAYTDHLRSKSTGPVYYRLKLVDMKGNSSYSQVVVVNSPNTNVNPEMKAIGAMDNINSNSDKDYADKKFDFEIYNTKGALVKMKRGLNREGLQALDFSELGIGSYLMKTISRSGISVQKFIRLN